MDCPACHAKNAADAGVCASCGQALKSSSSARRSSARRRNGDAGEAAAIDSNNPTAWRAYRVAMWALMPGLGLLLGPLAIVLGWLAVRAVGDDLSARCRAKAAVLFGVLVSLTQWLGATLIWHSLTG